MSALKRIDLPFLLVVFVLSAATLFAGCGEDATVTAPDPATDSSVLVQDPLDDFFVAAMAEGEIEAEEVPTEPQPRILRMAEYLELTQEQIDALVIAYTEFHEGMFDLRMAVRDGSLTRREAVAAAAELREVFEAALQVILTEEQYELLQEMREGGRRPEQPAHPDPVLRLQAALEEIGASAEQIDDVLAAWGVLREGIADLRDQVKAGELTQEEAQAAAETLRTDFDTALQSILTAEQYEALMALRPDCPRNG